MTDDNTPNEPEFQTALELRERVDDDADRDALEAEEPGRWRDFYRGP